MRLLFHTLPLLVALSFLAGNGRAAPRVHISQPGHSIQLNESCQAPKTSGQDPLDGCPKGTVFVSQTHPDAEFRTINSALSALPDDNITRTILIDAGEYHEKIIVTRRSPTIFAGITSSPSSALSNRVRIWQSTYVNQSDPTSTLHNCDTVVLSLISPTSSQRTDFKAYNIDFTQRQFFHGLPITQYQLGPSAALCVQSTTNASFYGCSFESYQDTIYVGSGSNAFFYNSVVRGMTDFIYGEGKAWFEKAKLLVRACGGGIAAWRGDPNNVKDEKVGVYISNSMVDRSFDASREKNLTGQCHLGRPWNADAHAVYLNTWMGDVVSQGGFKVWTKRQSNFVEGRTRFAEYNSSGPGGDMTRRNLLLERVLTDHEAKQITWRNVFGGAPHWIDTKRLAQQ